MVRGDRGEQIQAMRIPSMINLADCVLIVDGHRVPLSEPIQPLARGRWSFGVAATDAEFLTSQLGATGIVQTRNGVVLMRLKLHHVDPTLNLIEGR